MKIGDEGHICFRLLAPNIIASSEVPIDRDLRTNEPTVFMTDIRTDGTVDTGETACHIARVTRINEDGTVNAAGFNARGDSRQWQGVQVGAEPLPVTIESREDPAGHTFHLAADCPWDR